MLAIVVLAVSLSSLEAATAGQWMGLNGISIARTRKHKVKTIARQAIAEQSAERGAAITSSTSRPICWIVISRQMRQTRNRLATSVIFGQARVGCIWLLYWTCIPEGSSAGPPLVTLLCYALPGNVAAIA